MPFFFSRIDLRNFRFNALVICFNGDPPTTGFAARVGALVEEMTKVSGEPVLVVRFVPILHTGRSWKRAWPKSAKVTLLEIPALPVSRFRRLRALSVSLSSWLLRGLVRLVRPNVIQCECHEAAALALGLRFSGLLYVDVHGAAPEEAEYSRRTSQNKDMSIVQWLESTEAKMLTKFDKIIVVGQRMIEHLERKTGINLENKATLVPIFPDDSFLRPLSKAQWKRQLGLTGRTVFLYSGGMQTYQCVDEAIMWFVALKSFIPNAFFIILTPTVELARSKVEALCDGYIPDTRVLSVDKNDLADYISAADFGFVLREPELLNRVSSPTKAVEYLARGVRLICTAEAGSAADHVERFRAGVIVPLTPTPAEVEFTAAAIIRLSRHDVPVEDVHRELSRKRYRGTIKDLYGPR